MKIEIYEDDAGEWRWRMVARNGKIVADSGEGYRRRLGALRAVLRLLEVVRAREVPIVEVQ